MSNNVSIITESSESTESTETLLPDYRFRI